jgi:PAS domain S-box-containing protein
MKPRTQHAISILLGLTTVAILGIFSQSEIYYPEPKLVLWVVFTALIALNSAFGIPLGGGEVSMMPMITLTGALIMGIIPAAWAVVSGDILYGFARFLWPQRTSWPQDQRGLPLIATTAANVAMHGLSVIAAGTVYINLEGTIPAPTLIGGLILISAGVTYIITNYLIAGLFLAMRGKAHLIYLWNHLPRLLLYEAIPLIFVPLGAQIFIFQGFGQFGLFALCLMIVAIVLRDQANSHQRLSRRVQELDSLQAVGQALSASLDIDTITEAIYIEVAKLMPASNFYVALYNPESKEVSFPIVYEHNVRAEWLPRSTANGLTEYVLNTRKPLLIEGDVKSTVSKLGVEHYGQEALSWLGVPILAGGKTLGIIAVQSYPESQRTPIPQRFDQSHKEVLSTIAAQASVAIHNAQLYSQTDQTLALRVQELSSILSTAHEGILLLDQDLTVAEANRSLADFIGQSLSNILEQQLSDNTFSQKLGFQDDEVSEILEEMRSGEIEVHRTKVSIDPDQEKVYERVITPVLGENETISGWLLVFRDLTEELRLSQLREDLTRMLVHDLRSPMVTIQGGLDMIEILIRGDEDKEEILDMLDISRRGGEQMMGMINELLSIHKYESGQLTLNLDPVSLPQLFSEVAQSFYSVLKHVNITVSTDFAPDLPIMIIDRELIRRVIHNLMDNAVKFTEDGGKIKAWAKLDPEKENQILFGIKDTGIGFSQEVHDQLFQKYFSMRDQKSRRKGTGIGLYFCKLAVQTHGGDIWVESEPGVGSNFIFSIPSETKSPA